MPIIFYQVNISYSTHLLSYFLKNAIGIFLQFVSPLEQAKRVDLASFADVFGEKLIPLQREQSDYLMALL
jgi:hypothetical protein